MASNFTGQIQMSQQPAMGQPVPGIPANLNVQVLLEVVEKILPGGPVMWNRVSRHYRNRDSNNKQVFSGRELSEAFRKIADMEDGGGFVTEWAKYIAEKIDTRVDLDEAEDDLRNLMMGKPPAVEDTEMKDQ